MLGAVGLVACLLLWLIWTRPDVSARAAEPPSATAAAAPTQAAPSPRASQGWLGTVVTVTDSAESEAPARAWGESPAVRWLRERACEYGFVLAPAATVEGHLHSAEPWKVRWVGREMAAHSHALIYVSDPTRTVIAELARAENQLAARAALQPPLMAR